MLTIDPQHNGTLQPWQKEIAPQSAGPSDAQYMCCGSPFDWRHVSRQGVIPTIRKARTAGRSTRPPVPPLKHYRYLLVIELPPIIRRFQRANITEIRPPLPLEGRTLRAFAPGCQ